MRLVEGIPSKGFYQGKNITGQTGGEALLPGPGDKVALLLFHYLGNLLAHRLAQDVRLA